jgi:hypothetical protein
MAGMPRSSRLSQRAASLLLLAPTTLLSLTVYLGGLVMVVAMSIDMRAARPSPITARYLPPHRSA